MEATKQYQVKEINSRQRTFITKRATVTFDKLPAFFSEQYNGIYKALQQKQVVPTEPPCAIYYSINEIGKETDLAAAIPVPADTSDIIGFEKNYYSAIKGFNYYLLWVIRQYATRLCSNGKISSGA